MQPVASRASPRPDVPVLYFDADLVLSLGRTAIKHADEVILARKGAKSRISITGLRSMTTKARTHVDRVRAANVDLKKKLVEALE
jgi:hypothetical protein